MKVRNLKIETVDILVEPYLNEGWEYVYWGKHFIIKKEIKRDEFIKRVLEELNAIDYEFTPEDVDFPITSAKIAGNFCACLYQDKHDGDHYGIVIFHIEEVKQFINDYFERVKKEYKEFLEDIKNED